MLSYNNIPYKLDSVGFIIKPCHCFYPPYETFSKTQIHKFAETNFKAESVSLLRKKQNIVF